MTRAAAGATGPPPMPANLAAERAVLGAALLEPLPEVLSLDPRCFHAEKHRRILAAMRAVAGRGEAVDSITVTAELARTGALEEAGGPAHLALLLEEAAVSIHTSDYITELCALAARRAVLRRSRALAVAARDGADPGSLARELEQATAEVAALASPNGRGADTAPPEGAPVLVRMIDVRPEAVSWLWPGRVARGKLTLVIGDPGLGKSFITLDVAARVTTGATWPASPARAPLGAVIVLSAEDGLADTIRPRLDDLGGDPARLWALTSVRREETDEPVCLARDLPPLEAAIRQTDAILCLVDPLSAYLGGRDSYKDAEIRGLLGPLAALAERTRVAVLAIMHLTKNPMTKLLYRGQGSIAFVAAARSVLAVARDPEDEKGARRLLVPIKSNLAPLAPTLAYRLEQGRVAWEPEPVGVVEPDRLLGGLEGPDDREARADAESLLCELLAPGEMPALDMLKAARANGISERTLYRAKKRLGVAARHEGQPGHRGAWFWSLAESPKAATAPPKAATRDEVAAFEQAREETDETAPTSPKAANFPHVAAFGGSLREPETLEL